MRSARPSASAVLPTPGSPTSSGLFLRRRHSTWIIRSISSWRPISGSMPPLRGARDQIVGKRLERPQPQLRHVPSGLEHHAAPVGRDGERQRIGGRRRHDLQSSLGWLEGIGCRERDDRQRRANGQRDSRPAGIGAYRAANGRRPRHAAGRRLEGALHRQAHIGDVVKPLAEILLQATLDAHPKRRRRVGGKRAPVRLHRDHVGQQIGGAIARECRSAGQHLVQHAAERPDVAALVDGPSPRLLGAHVRGGAEQSAVLCDPSGLRCGIGIRFTAGAHQPWRGRSRAPSPALRA